MNCRKCGAQKITKRRAGVFSCKRCGVQPGPMNLDRGGLGVNVPPTTATASITGSHYEHWKRGMIERKQTTAVVYNNRHGRFGLSREAVLLGRSISEDPTWGGPYGHYSGSRTDKTLIAVIASLGTAKASAANSRLAIEQIPDGSKYRIDEHGGIETVMTPEDYDWKIAQ